MPQLANIAIADGEASPVTHTFSGTTTNGSKAVLHNRAASIPRGWETLTVEVIQPQSATGAYRVLIGFIFPTVATVDGQDKVVRQNKVDMALNFSQDSSEQDRKNARLLIANLFSDSLMASVIEDVEPLH